MENKNHEGDVFQGSKRCDCATCWCQETEAAKQEDAHREARERQKH
jgi:hypothetical protein